MTGPSGCETTMCEPHPSLGGALLHVRTHFREGGENLGQIETSLEHVDTVVHTDPRLLIHRDRSRGLLGTRWHRRAASSSSTSLE